MMTTLPHKFYVVQVGYGLFGFGDTREEAIAEARNWIDRDKRDAFAPSRFVGSDRTGDSIGRKLMTDRGELYEGEMVSCSDEEFVRIVGDELAREYLRHAGLI